MDSIAARDLTIGVCHVAYQIQSILQQQLPECDVFQEMDAEALRRRMSEIDILVVSNAWQDSLLDTATRLRWIQSIGVGFNQFPLNELRQRGIYLTNAVGVNASAVSEHALALMLALSRRIPEARDNQLRKNWRPMITDPLQREDELGGKTLGIVGLGSIGNRLATLGQALGMRVIGTKGNPDTYQGVADQVLPASELGQLLEAADYVVLCCPLSESTTNLIGATEFQSMRRTAFLINVARGPVVDQAELVAALRHGLIAGAAIDVTDVEPLERESPLWEIPNLLITPHTGGETSHYERRLVDIIVQNVRRWERGEPFLHRIV